MLSYFRNLSTFRIFVLVLLVTAGGMMLYGRMRDAAARPRYDDAYRRTNYALHSGALRFGNYLSAQRALAQTIAVQFRLMEAGPDHAETRRVLEEIMERSPRTILGVGVSLPEGQGSGEAPRVVTYLARAAPPPEEEKISHILYDSPYDGKAPYESAWTLTASPSVSGTTELSIIASVAISREDGGRGEAVVKADLAELRGILTQIKSNGVEEPLCVTPKGDIIWLDGSVLAYDKELALGDVGTMAGRILEARQFIDGRKTRGFVRADAGATGWYFLAATPGQVDGERAGLPLPVYLFAFALALMLLEGAVSRLWSRAARQRETISANAELVGADAPPPGEPRSFLATAYDYMFKYRVTNPDTARLDSELRVARQIQFSLVPDRFPVYSEWREFDLFSMLEPAREVGGDYYDFFMLDSNRIVITVGDVSGNGIPAALYMAVCRTAFRTLARQSKDPGEIMTRLNELLIRDNHSGLYVTIACCIVDLPTGKCQYALAGHPAPLHYSASNGSVEFIDQPRETFAGVKQSIVYPVGEMTLGRGDTLLLYTDGLPDARNEAGREFEYETLRKTFASHAAADTCRELVNGIERSVLAFAGKRVQLDDVTVMAFRYWGPGGQIIGREMCRIPKSRPTSVRIKKETSDGQGG